MFLYVLQGILVEAGARFLDINIIHKTQDFFESLHTNTDLC